MLKTALAGLLAVLLSGTSANWMPASCQSQPIKEENMSQQSITENNQLLLHLWEEEKLAHDVYTALGNQWRQPVFFNIASSESRHFQRMQALLTSHQIPVPKPKPMGAFHSAELAGLYQQLTTEGQESLVSALKVGANIEQQDIADLQKLKNSHLSKEANWVSSQLLRASRNHLRAFCTNLSSNGASCVATALSKQEVQEILSSPHEPGRHGKGQGRGKGRGRYHK